MPIFISYSHSDKLFVDELAINLVKKGINVWIDRWELNVGDSIVNKVQEAIQESSALLVVLSKASVESEWCKKELSVGLIRELEEKKVIILPILLEECSIPPFLRDKKFADFRTNFDVGLSDLLDGVAQVTNVNQSRLEEINGYIDWAVDWGYQEDLFTMRFVIIDSSLIMPVTILTEIVMYFDESTTKRYRQYEESKIDWLGRLTLTETLKDVIEAEDIHLVLDDNFPKSFTLYFGDKKTSSYYPVIITCRKLGNDNGKSQAVNITRYISRIRTYMKDISRKPTPEEFVRFMEIVKSPIA